MESSETTASTSSGPLANNSTSTTITKRRPIPRKGHTKSRAGCSICKGRKVKCDLVTPECGACRRLGLECKYLGEPSGPRSEVAISRSLRSDPVKFDNNDLNFFRHFLFEAYPAFPIDGFTVWQQAAKLSHKVSQVPVLPLDNMADLDRYERAALKHRVIAISALRKHLANPDVTKRDVEAAFGTMLSLLFQSAYMTEGLIDFLTIVRGCWLVSTRPHVSLDNTIFKKFGRLGYVERIKVIVSPLCHTVAELQYLAQLEKIATQASTNPAESYREYSLLYDILGYLSSDDFASFIDTKNYASQLVIMHMLVVEFVMGRKTVNEDKMSTPSQKSHYYRKAMSKVWIQQILEKLPLEYREYGEWTLNFINSLDYSFDDEDQVWKPFVLSSGRAILLKGESS
ncbi:sterol uptake control 2 [Fusarium heterosporum]|uniref:Sterol uptake control 2 n=1 Tax=Fusarium heterosporum TaxID=42747 RepID=A0A8H5TAG0_FUSHE|nr:sterol uptake control 2 [Fusarium heterosporum]